MSPQNHKNKRQQIVPLAMPRHNHKNRKQQIVVPGTPLHNHNNLRLQFVLLAMPLRNPKKLQATNRTSCHVPTNHTFGHAPTQQQKLEDSCFFPCPYTTTKTRGNKSYFFPTQPQSKTQQIVLLGVAPYNKLEATKSYFLPCPHRTTRIEVTNRTSCHAPAQLQ